MYNRRTTIQQYVHDNGCQLICFVIQEPTGFLFSWTRACGLQQAFLSFCHIFPTFYFGSSKHGAIVKQVVGRGPSIVSVCVCLWSPVVSFHV